MTIHAEQAVIAGCITNAEHFDTASVVLTADDFSDETCATVFRAITAMHERGRSVDAVTLGSVLNRSGKWTALRVGDGTDYAMALVSVAVSLPLFNSYVGIVQSTGASRALSVSAGKIAEVAAGDGTADEKFADAASIVVDLAKSGRIVESVSGFDAAKEAVAEICAMAERGGGLAGHSTGFRDLDAMTSGLQSSQLIVLGARPGMGKAQPLDARVRTPRGWTSMGSLAVGDEISSTNGDRSNVVGVFPQGKRQVYRMTFSDGRSAEACAEHLWSVSFRKWDAPRVMQTSELIDLIAEKQYQRRVWIDPVAVECEASDLPIRPWLLGALLGDGCMSGACVRFSNSNADMQERVRAELPESDEMVNAGGIDWRIKRKTRTNGRTSLRLALEFLGLSDCLAASKFIPRIYLDAPIADRLELIRGLIDTDGSVEKFGVMRYSTSSKRMADQFVELIRSVGGLCSVASREPTYSYRGSQRKGQTNYLCTVFHRDMRSLVTLAPKRDRLDGRGGRRVRRLTIQSIKPSRIAETQCIAVSHPSRLYITDDYVVTHNTAMCLNLALNVARTVPVHIFSLEMSAADLAKRMLTSLGRINFGDLQSGKLDHQEVDRLTAASLQLKQLPIRIDDHGGLSISQIRARARMAARRDKPGLIVIDYLTLVRGEGETQTLRVGSVSTGLKNLAKELECPVLCLAQLNRALEQRPNKRPMESDLRDSGQIEQDADLILFNYLDEKYNDDSEFAGMLELIVAKQRNGVTGKVLLEWQAQYQTFRDRDPHAPMPQVETKSKPARRLSAVVNGDTEPHWGDGF